MLEAKKRGDVQPWTLTLMLTELAAQIWIRGHLY